MRIDVMKLAPAISILVRVIVALIYGTSRYKIVGSHDFVIERLKNNQPIIFVLWHNSIMGGTGYFIKLLRRGFPFRTIASKSKDGDIATKILKDYGGNGRIIRGSSSKGGEKAFALLLEELKKGNSLLITIDGPIGPKYECKTGTIRLAALTGAPIVPFEFGAKKEFYFRHSWDNFRLPKPFNPGIFFIGKPIFFHNEISPFYYPQAVAFLNQHLLNLTTLAAKYTKTKTSLL